MMTLCDFSASSMANKDRQRFDHWIEKNADALAEELKALLPAAKESCPECDGNGCVECQPEVWFACPNHPDHRVQSNGWVPCPTCGAALAMDSESDQPHGAAGGTRQQMNREELAKAARQVCRAIRLGCLSERQAPDPSSGPLRELFEDAHRERSPAVGVQRHCSGCVAKTEDLEARKKWLQSEALRYYSYARQQMEAVKGYIDRGEWGMALDTLARVRNDNQSSEGCLHGLHILTAPQYGPNKQQTEKQ